MFEELPIILFRRLRPFEGWTPFVFALGLIICLLQLAASAQLPIPSGTVGMAGLAGLLVGRAIGRWGMPPRRQQKEDEPGALVQDDSQPARWKHWAYWATVALVLLVGGGFWTLQSGETLPPANLVWRDAATVGRLIGERLAPTPPTDPDSPEPPTPDDQPAPVTTRWDSLAFLQSSLPRFGQELQNAPNGGTVGARLIAELTSVLLTWSALFLLGIALRRNGRLVRWTLPALVALVLVKLLGGGAGPWLVAGLGLLMLLVLFDESTRREQRWLARKLDYASDLRLDAVVWGGITLVVTLSLASALPFTFDNRVARWIWSWIEPPSGIAALERTMEENDRPRSNPVRSQVAGSTLPSVALGQSLEEGDSDEQALRIHVSQPLPPGPWPTYWRSRVLSIYTGSSWYTNALVTPDTPLDIPAGVSVDLIVQDVEDQRSDRQLIYGLPNIVGVNVPSNAERLPDGTLMATTLNGPGGRYRVFSQPPSVAPVQAERPEDQPDMTPYLQLPPSLPPRVVDLARTISRDAVTQNDVGLALERFLRELPYSYEVAPLLDEDDAVDQFLFSMRQGYCTYYASAFAVLARSLNIPARVSIGYATGEYDAATQTYTVYERDAHAWPELYLSGRWVPFEPTPVRPLPARTGTQSQPQRLPVEPAPAPVVPLWEQLSAYWPGALAILLLLVALSLPWLPRLRPDYSPRSIQRQLEQRGTRAGIVWPAGATLSEYATMLRPRLGPAATALDTLVFLLEEARYSGRALSPDQQGRLLVAWSAVKQRIGSIKQQGRS